MSSWKSFIVNELLQFLLLAVSHDTILCLAKPHWSLKASHGCCCAVHLVPITEVTEEQMAWRDESTLTIVWHWRPSVVSVLVVAIKVENILFKIYVSNLSPIYSSAFWIHRWRKFPLFAEEWLVHSHTHTHTPTPTNTPTPIHPHPTHPHTPIHSRSIQ